MFESKFNKVYLQIINEMNNNLVKEEVGIGTLTNIPNRLVIALQKKNKKVLKYINNINNEKFNLLKETFNKYKNKINEDNSQEIKDEFETIVNDLADEENKEIDVILNNLEKFCRKNK